MPDGRVKWFNEKKGYGFITKDDGEDVFVHYSEIEMDGFKTLSENQEVTFELKEGPRGLQATNVKALGTLNTTSKAPVSRGFFVDLQPYVN